MKGHSKLVLHIYNGWPEQSDRIHACNLWPPEESNSMVSSVEFYNERKRQLGQLASRLSFFLIENLRKHLEGADGDNHVKLYATLDEVIGHPLARYSLLLHPLRKSATFGMEGCERVWIGTLVEPEIQFRSTRISKTFTAKRQKVISHSVCVHIYTEGEGGRLRKKQLIWCPPAFLIGSCPENVRKASFKNKQWEAARHVQRRFWTSVLQLPRLVRSWWSSASSESDRANVLVFANYM